MHRTTPTLKSGTEFVLFYRRNEPTAVQERIEVTYDQSKPGSCVDKQHTNDMEMQEKTPEKSSKMPYIKCASDSLNVITNCKKNATVSLKRKIKFKIAESLAVTDTTGDSESTKKQKISCVSPPLTSCVIDSPSAKENKLIFANQSLQETDFVKSPFHKYGKKLSFKERFKSRRILNRLNVKKRSDLPPKQSYLFDHIKMLEKKVKQVQLLLKKCKGDKSKLESESEKKMLKTLESALSPSMYRLVCSNIRFKKKGTKAKGRRWSAEEKLDMVQLYKSSPRSYELLRSMINLPSKRTLISLINKLELQPGINKQIFQQLKDYGQTMDPLDKFVNLVFDETLIKKSLVFNKKRGLIDGYVDHGSFGRENKIANQALIFLIHGIHNNWTMPLHYTFADKTTPSAIMKDLIIEVIRELREAGFTVVSCCCDQGSTNRGALKLLGASEEKPYFILDGQQVICIFDPSHILKCTRTGLRKHGVVIDGLRVNWETIRETKKLDNSSRVQSLSHIDQRQLDPQRKELMRDIFAIHIISNRVAAAIFREIRLKKLPKSAAGAALFLERLNKVFDTLNSGSQTDFKSVYRNPVTNTSRHLAMWEAAIPWIQSWKFVDNNGKDLPNKSSWIWTIRGVQLIWNKLQTYGLTELATRHLSSDCIENFNGQIKSSCGSNPKPNVTQFQYAFKGALINAKKPPHSLKSNCEDDRSYQLTDLSSLLYADFDVEESTPVQEEHISDHSEDEETDLVLDDLNKVEYQNGSVIARKILITMTTKTKCTECKGSMYVKCRNELSPCTLKYHQSLDHDKSISAQNRYFPSQNFTRNFSQGVVFVDRLLPKFGHREDLYTFVSKKLEKTLHLSWLGCQEHSNALKSVFLEHIIHFSSNKFCTNRNGYLETVDDPEQMYDDDDEDP